jgi:hypothetical protein
LKIIVYVLALITLTTPITQALCQSISQEEAEAKIGEAEGAFNAAYNAVLEAERAGANISTLIVKLNVAGGFLAEAKNAFRVGNFSEAFGKAENCLAMLDGIAENALKLKGLAMAESQKAFWQSLVFSCLGSFGFLVGLFYFWSRFKSAYTKKLLKMKPEVASDAEY